MARTSHIAKANKKPKFSTRQHNRCQICGRPRAFSAQVRRLPSVLPRPGAPGRDSRGLEVVLVNGRDQLADRAWSGQRVLAFTLTKTLSLVLS